MLKNCGSVPDTAGAIGISGMMHGYLPFDKEGRQLAVEKAAVETM